MGRMLGWLRAAFRRGALDREMREEMALHLERATARLTARGMAETAAREAARREFGNVALLQEEGRDARGARWIESVAADVRFAIRHFARAPLTAATVIFVLAFGIGVNSALFSLLQAITSRPAPGVPRDDALVRVRGTSLPRQEGRLYMRALSLPELGDLAAQRETFASVAGWVTDEMVLDLVDGSDPRTLRGEFVTAGYFSTLGLRPVLGGGLPSGRVGDVAGTELAVMLAHSVWSEELGGDSAVIGRAVRVNDVPVRIAGVAPQRFRGAVPGSETSLWVPLEARAALLRGTAHALASRDSALLQAAARLEPDVTPERATAVARVVAASAVAQMAPASLHERSTDVVLLRGDTELPVNDEFFLAVGAVGALGLLILLVACTNVSALLVGAAVARRQEIAVRLSLGASRVRLVRQLVTESGLLALGGGALGLLLYWWLTKLAQARITEAEITPDLGTVAFTVFFALGTGILFGLSPALHATRWDVATALKDSGRGATGRSRLQRGFIAAQIMLTQPLLVAIAMLVILIRSEGDLRSNDETTRHVIGAGFTTFGGAGSPDPVRERRVRDFMDRVATMPGVVGVVPEAAAYDIVNFTLDPTDGGDAARADESVRVHLEGTHPGYFAALKVPILRGRDVRLTDTTGRDIAIVVGSDLARRLWGSTDPIGKRLYASTGFIVRGRTAVVVGVFDASQATSRRGGVRVYSASGGRWRKDMYLIRTTGPGESMVPTIRQLSRKEIPDIAPRRLETFAQTAREQQREVSQVTGGAAGAGLLALLLTSIGLYGVVALAVGQRQREIGIRVALGARPSEIVARFFVSGVRLSILGLLLGLPLSLAALKTVLSAVPEFPKISVWPVGLALGTVVLAVASMATWLPARRAAGVDPVVALRVE